MDNEAIIKKEKLTFNGIMGQSLRIIAKNPKLLFLTLFTSITLFISLICFEFVFQKAMHDSAVTLLSEESYSFTSCSGGFCVHEYHPWSHLDRMKLFVLKHFHQFAFLGFLYLILVHPLDLLNTILIVRNSSNLYAGEALQSYLLKQVNDIGFAGPMVTSFYALLLSVFISLGLLSLGTNFYLFYPKQYEDTMVLITNVLVLLMFGGSFVALLIKYVEWRSVCNLGMVISILEEKHGHIAIGVAAYISKRSRRCGFLLMFAFFMGRICVRALCLYLVWGKERENAGVGAMVAQVLVVCIINLIEWVVFMVYYCDCKETILEKKIDVEDGKSREQKTIA